MHIPDTKTQTQQGTETQGEAKDDESTHCLWMIRTNLQGQEMDLNHVATLPMSVRRQDHAFELSGGIFTRPSKEGFQRRILLKSSIRMIAELPSFPAEFPSDPLGS